MLTNGGLGIALLWPVFSAAGIPVFASELLYVWLPCALAGFTVYAMVGRSKGGGCER